MDNLIFIRALSAYFIIFATCLAIIGGVSLVVRAAILAAKIGLALGIVALIAGLFKHGMGLFV